MQELNLKTFEEKIQSGEETVVLFYSPTCAHCKRTETGIEELETEGVQTFRKSGHYGGAGTGLPVGYTGTANPFVFPEWSGERQKNRFYT